MEYLEELIERYEKSIDSDFDFEVEHWWNGNYDDSFNYGVDSATQIIYTNLTEELKKLRTILENK